MSRVAAAQEDLEKVHTTKLEKKLFGSELKQSTLLNWKWVKKVHHKKDQQ